MILIPVLRHVRNGIFATLFAAAPAMAADGFWNVDAAANWSAAGSWAGGIPGAISGTTNGDIANFGFPLTAGRTVTVDANRNVRGITFSNYSSYGYTLSGGPLLLSNAGIISTAADNGEHVDTIGCAIVIEGDGGGATFTADAYDGLSTLSIGAVSGVSTGANVTKLTLNGGNGGDNAITGVIGNGTGAGSLAVTKSGSGVWILSGANSFSGQLTVEDGTLKVGSMNNASAAGVFGNSALSVILGKSGGSTGTLEYTAATTTTTKRFTLATGGGGAFQIDASDANLTLTGAIDGAGPLTKTGYGTLTLSAANTFTGGVNLYNGVLNLGNNTGSLGSSGTIGMNGGTLQFTSTNKTDYSNRFSTADGQYFNFDTNNQIVTLASAMTGSGGSLTKLGGGTLTLSGANTYDGGTWIKAGTLALSGSGTLGSSGMLTVDGTTGGLPILSLGTTIQTVSDVYLWGGAQITGTGTGTLSSSTTFNVESGSISAILGGAGGLLKNESTGTGTNVTLSGANSYSGGTTILSGTLTLSGSGTLGASGGSLTVDGASGGMPILALGATNQTVGAVSVLNGGQITGTGTLTAASFNVESGTFGVNLAGEAAVLTKGGAGTVTLSGTNTYHGGTTVTAGTLAVTKASSLPGIGVIKVAGGVTLALNVGGNGEFALADLNNVMANGSFVANSILALNATSAFTYSGNLNGAFTLGKIGGGTVTLAGLNSYNGTNVTAGMLALSGSGTLGASNGALTVNGTGAIVSLGTTNQTVGTVTLLNGGQITGSGGVLTGSAFTVENGAITAKLAGAGAILTKGNIGTVTLSGVNSYDGGTIVSNGTLSLSIGGALGSNTGSLTVDGGAGGTPILNLGATVQTVGAVSLLNGGAISGSGTLIGASFNLSGGTISAKLDGASALLTKAGPGMVTLSGPNTYGGGTHVDAGTLLVAKLASLPGQALAGLITVAGGATLAVNAGGSGEFAATDISNILTKASFVPGSIIGIDTTNASGGSFAYNLGMTGSFGLTKSGVGTLALSGTGITYGGGTIVKAGTLAISGAGTLGSGGGLTADGASTIVNLGGTTQTVGAVSLLNGAQIINGTLSGTSFYVASGSIGANLAGSAAVLTKDTAGTVTLTGTNTYDGGVVLTNGLLVLGGSGALGNSGTLHLAGGTLQFTAANNIDYSNRFSADAGQSFNFDTNGQTITLAADLTSSGGSLTKYGAGTLVLTGTNNYSGLTFINAGTLQVAMAASLPGLANPSQITMADGTVLAINAGGSGEFSSTDITHLLNSVVFTSNTTLAIDTSHGDFNYGGQIATALKLLKLGGNTLTLSGANSYTGGTIIGAANQANAGTLRFSGAGTLGTNGPLALYGGTLDLNGTTQALTTLTLGGGAAGSTAAVSVAAGELRLGDNLTFVATNNPGGATISGVGGGKLSLLGNRTFTVGDSTAVANDLTISAIIQNGDTTARSLTKTGAGTLLLTGANTYASVTTVSTGTLQAAIPTALPGRAASNRIIVAGGATLAVNAGGANEWAAADITTLLNNVTFSATTAALGIDTTNANGGTFTGPNITGARSLNKLGGGTLVLAGTGNTYTGATFVTAGTLQVTGTLASGGVVTVPTGGTMEIASSASVGRSVTVSGGVLNLSGTLAGGTSLNLTDGTINSLGGAASAATVVMPLPTATAVLSAPAGQELAVTTKLTQAVSDGSIAFTAGSTAFKVGGGNLVSNVDKLIVRGGTTKIERIVGAMSAGLEVRAWKGVNALEGTLFDLPGSPDNSSTAGNIGYATNAIHFGSSNGEHFADSSSGVTPGSTPITGYQDTYTVEYRGKLRITSEGNYTFSTYSDDGSALWIDPLTNPTNPAYSTANVKNDGVHAMQQANSSPIHLLPGDHDIIVRFYENNGGVGIWVQWDPAGGGNFVDIPGSNFFHGNQATVALNLPATELAVTATSSVDLGFAGAATLGNLTLTGASSALTLQTATRVSFDNITAIDTGTVAAGPPLVLRTGNVTVADTKTLTVTPSLVDGPAPTVLNKLGGGTLILSGSNTYTGATTVTAGNLTLGAANTNTGATILNGGTLTVANANALQFSTVTFNGGVLDTGVLTSVPLGGITANVDTTTNSAMSTLSGYPTWSAATGKTLTLGGAITRMPGAAINFGATGTITGTPLGTLLGTNKVNPWATSAGTGWAIYDGSKIVAYTAYTAATGTAAAPTLTSAPVANGRIDNTTSNNVTLAATGTIDINTLVLNGSTGRTIDLKNGSTQGALRLGSAGAILLAGGSHTIGVSGSAGTLTAGGAINNAAGELTVMANSAGTINSVIADNGTGKVSFVKNGSATVTLNGNNTYSGDTTIASGILGTVSGGGKDIIPNGLGKGNLSIGAGATLALIGATETINGLNGAGTVYGDTATAGRLTLGDGNASGTFSGGLCDGATGILHLTKMGSGTETLTGTNTYTGTTTVSNGTLALDFSANNPTSILNGSTALTLSGGTLSVKGKSFGTASQGVASLTLTIGSSGSSAISVDANGGAGTLLSLGNITHPVGTSLNFTLPAGTQSATNGITTAFPVVNNILGAYATVGSNWASKNGANIIALAAYTDVAALGGSIATGTTTNVRINSAGSGANLALGAATVTISTLLQNTSTAATVDTLNKTLQTGGIMLASGQAALTIGAAVGNGVLTAATAGGELDLINNNTGSNLTINAAVQNNSSASALTKVGLGTVVLAGTNTYTGATTIGGGTLSLTGTIGSVGATAVNSAATFSEATTGVIAGTSSLTVSGGVTTLAGANTYSGATAVNGGKLSVGSTGTINTSSGITIGAGEFNYNSATALSKSVTFSSSGGILSGTGTITPLVTVTANNTLAPGNSIGTLGFGTGLAIAGTYAAQLGTAGPLATPANGSSDRAAVTGNLTLTGGTLSLSDNAAANGQGSAGVGAYRLLTFTGTLTGTFASVINPLSSTLHEKVIYNGSSNSSVDLNLYRVAAASAHTPEPLNLGTFHVGATASTALSLTNTAAGDGFSEKLSAAIGSATGDAVASGSFSQLTAQATNNTSLLAGINTATVGNKSGTATITLSSDGTGTSNYGTSAIGTQTVNVSGTVYSGLMAWSGVSGGTWNANANWYDSQAATVHVAAGLDTAFTGVDTATFGNTAGNVTVNLDAATPNLNALIFNATGSYTIAQGSGSNAITLAGSAPSITVAGSHTISAPVILANNATITPTNAGDSLTISGVVSGSGRNLTKDGAGTLTLNAANSYTGITSVTNGTLAIGASGSLANSVLTVQSGATLAGSGSIGGSSTIQGIAAPGGGSVGILTFTNSLALAATSHLQWQLTDNLTTSRGTVFDGVNVTGGTFAVTPGATLDLSFGGSVDFANSFWKSSQTWTLVDLTSGLTGDGGTDLFTLGAITGGSYNSAEGAFSVARVADANSKQDVVLKWTAATSGSSPYQTWIDSFTGIPVADRDPGDDPDHDGANNLAEFAFDGVPNDGTRHGLLFNAVDTNAKRLVFTCAARRSASVNFAANSDGAQTATIDGVTYIIEGSSTLTGIWNSPVAYVGKSDSAPAGSGLPGLAATAWEYRTFSAFNGLTGPGFMRARVSMASSGSSTPYQTWIDGYSGSIPSASDRLPAADPDHDTSNNLAEFAFDGVPNDATKRGLLYNTVDTTNKRLVLTCAVRRSASVNFAANGDGAQTATIDGVTYIIEGSSTLTGTWNSPVAYAGKSDSPPAGSNLPSLVGTDWEYRSFSAFNGLPGSGFIRARVSMP